MRSNRSAFFSASRMTVRAVAAGLAVFALALAPSPVPAWGGSVSPHVAPEVFRQWAATASATIQTDARRPAPEPLIWQSFVSAAMYNAVVGIQGQYAPYRWNVRGPRSASPAAAAAAAAHRVLLTYFPASAPRLEAAYTASLAKIPDGRAKDEGVAFGKRAADRMVSSRKEDGRFAPVEFTIPPATGVWRPTPTTHQPFSSAWMGRLKPLLIASPDQFRPSGPPALTSARYTEDLAEVRALGAKTGSDRSPAQTETARFFTGDLHIQDSLCDYAARHHFTIAETARLLAATSTAQADALITAWDSKLYYGSWRPVTAIRLADTDGNTETDPDPEWLPLFNTPAHPDYLSGHTTHGGALMRILTGLLGTSRVDLYISSQATNSTRYYEHADQYTRDVINARVWAGVHFRSADTAGNRTGQRLAAWALTHYFQPVH
ncbi:vanadium-dependent haloperoxidase [Streptomyces netropsis]|uniref:vanadium-dependent haloperoxidase n=1 Tax=Streptomyces netropsis TaxID=55404 RepID=UPI00378F5833